MIAVTCYGMRWSGYQHEFYQLSIGPDLSELSVASYQQQTFDCQLQAREESCFHGPLISDLEHTGLPITLQLPLKLTAAYITYVSYHHRYQVCCL